MSESYRLGRKPAEVYSPITTSRLRPKTTKALDKRLAEHMQTSENRTDFCIIHPLRLPVHEMYPQADIFIAVITMGND